MYAVFQWLGGFIWDARCSVAAAPLHSLTHHPSTHPHAADDMICNAPAVFVFFFSFGILIFTWQFWNLPSSSQLSTKYMFEKDGDKSESPRAGTGRIARGGFCMLHIAGWATPFSSRLPWSTRRNITRHITVVLRLQIDSRQPDYVRITSSSIVGDARHTR